MNIRFSPRTQDTLSGLRYHRGRSCAAVLRPPPDTNAAPNPYLQRGKPAFRNNPNPSCNAATLSHLARPESYPSYTRCRPTDTKQIFVRRTTPMPYGRFCRKKSSRPTG